MSRPPTRRLARLAIRLSGVVALVTGSLVLRPPALAGDSPLPATPTTASLAHGSTPRWRLTFGRTTRLIIESAHCGRATASAPVHLTRPPDTDRPFLRSHPTALAAPHFAATHEDARLTLALSCARRTPVDCSAAVGPYPPALDLGCLPPIEPPGLCTPAVGGVSAYFDLELGLSDDEPVDRGWSAGFAIDF